MLVEEHESRCDLCSVEPRTRLIEFSRPLNLEHEVSTIYIFHDEKKAVLEGEKKMLLNPHQYRPLGLNGGKGCLMAG